MQNNPALAVSTPAALEPGFVSLFNGHDLSGWEGDPRVWSVRDGVLTGQTTPKAGAGATFLIWTNGTVTDFELRFSFRVPQANSGIAYRGNEFGNGAVFGYQYVITDMSAKGGEIGQLFDCGAKSVQAVWATGRGHLLGVLGQESRWEPMEQFDAMARLRPRQSKRWRPSRPTIGMRASLSHSKTT